MNQGVILQRFFEKYLFAALMILTVLISFIAFLFPGLLPTPGLLVY